MLQLPKAVGVTTKRRGEQEGRYVQHNVGAMGFEGDDVQDFYLEEAEKQLNPSPSTTSFQSFEMKERTGSYVSTHVSEQLQKKLKSVSLHIQQHPYKSNAQLVEYTP